MRQVGLWLLLCALWCWAVPASAKVTNSIGNGDWSNAATWDNGVPADGDQISIQSAHTVTLSSSVNFVALSATLTINGTLDLGTFSCRVTTTTVSATGQVIQNTSSGAPVPANLLATTLTLNPASTYRYTGNQTGLTGAHPQYGHLLYSSTATTAGVFEVNLKVNGNLTISNSGAGEIQFGNTTNHSHTIAGNFTISSGNVAGSAGSANVAIDVNGNFTINTGAAFKACAGNGGLTFNLAGNLTVSGSISSPGAGNFNLILDGGANALLSGTLPLSLPYITMSKLNGANATLNQQLTVTKNLNFLSGKIFIGNHNFTQAAGASVSGASGSTGYIETNGTGKMIVAQASPSANFPVGNGSYTPVILAPDFPTSAFSVLVANGFPAEIPGCGGYVTDDAVKKMWIVAREQGTSSILNITFYWNGSDEGSTFDRSVCGVVRYLSNNWEVPVPNTATGSDPYWRGRVFNGTITGGTFGVLDNSAEVNLVAPSGAANSPLCAGQTLNLTLTSNPVAGAGYQWSRQSGGFTPPAGPNATINNVQPADAGNYVLTMSKYGCNYTATAVPVSIYPVPACSIEGPLKVCTGSAGHTYIAAGGLSSYTWTVSGNGSISGPANGPSVVVNAGAPGIYTVTLVVTDQNNCKATCSTEVKVAPRPTGNLSGTTTICAGQSATLSIAVTGEGPWTGTLSNGTPFSGNSSPILVNVTPGTTTTYTLGSLSDANCTATPNDLSGSATVSIDALQIFQITGGGAYCAGGAGKAVGLSGSQSGVSYQLFLNGNPSGGAVSGTGLALSFGNQTAAGAYTVVATRPTTGCTALMGGSVSVTINPAPVVNLVLGDNSAAVTETNVLLTGGTPPGGTYSGPGVSGNSINPSVAGIGVHTITYTVTDNNGCTGSDSDDFAVVPGAGLNLITDAPQSVACGETFHVDIIDVAGFNKVGTLQFSVAWDKNQFMYLSDEPVTIENTAPLTEFVHDTLVYSWLDDDPNINTYGSTLANGSRILRIFFKSIRCGTPPSGIDIVGTPRVIEASDNTYGVMQVNILNANAIATTDNQPPVFANVPASVSVSCDQVPGPGMPTATDNCDNNVDIVYEGESVKPGSCAGAAAITRVWRATDDCGNTATAAQVIQVYDQTPPTFTAPPDITINLNSDCQYNASPDVTGKPGNLADNCAPADSLIASYTDISTAPTGSNMTITRYWRAVDDCGNVSSSKSQLIHVQDVTPPVVQCPANVTLSPNTNDCLYKVQGKELDPQASDNCGIATQTYLLSGATTGSGAGSLAGVVLNTGTTLIAWTVTDINGLTAFCSFVARVEQCTGITGKLIWEGDDVSGVAQATVYLTGASTDTDGPTTTNGLYTLIGGAGGNYSIKPVKPNPPALPLNGVTANDALIVQKHLQNNPPITDPYKLIAADVDSNYAVNGFDASLIRQAVLGSPTALEYFKKRPWRFVPTPDPGPGFPGYTPPSNPFSAPIPDARNLVGASGNVSNQNFFGIKIGDVDGSANPAQHPEALTPLVWAVYDQPLKAGQELTVMVRAAHFGELGAFQFGLRFDPAQMEWIGLEIIPSVLDLQPEEHFGLYQVEQGDIRCLWTDPEGKYVKENAPAFILRFRALQSGALLSDVFGLSGKVLEPEAYSVDGLSKTEVKLVFLDGQTTAAGNPDAQQAALLQNRPNPFSGSTTIGFILPQPCEAQLRVYDATGRAVWQVKRQYTAGYQEETINGLSTPATGLLYYELTTPFGRQTRRMVHAE